MLSIEPGGELTPCQHPWQASMETGFAAWRRSDTLTAGNYQSSSDSYPMFPLWFCAVVRLCGGLVNYRGQALATQTCALVSRLFDMATSWRLRCNNVNFASRESCNRGLAFPHLCSDCEGS